MNLASASAVIRPRTAWEAMDLGVRLVQRDYFALAARWIICTTPWAIAAFLAGRWLGNAIWGYLLFWWMKPAFDRVPLDYLSRRLFSGEQEQTNLWHLCVRLPLAYGAWRQLTYLRFGLSRAFTLPVDQLEGQDATTRRARLQTIVARDYGPAAWLTITLFFVAVTAHLTISSFLLTLWQPHQPFDTPVTMLEQYLDSWASIPGVVAYIDFLAFYIVHSVIELFYVGAGFALYLNRRTHLEAWDIELAFRRLAARLKSGAAALLLPLMLCVSALSPGVDALAQAPDSAPSGTPAMPGQTSLHSQRMRDRETIRSILDSGAFGKLESTMKWQKKEQPHDTEADEPSADTDAATDDDATTLMNIVVSALKYMIIALFASLIGSWVFRHRHLLFATGTAAGARHKKRRESDSGQLPDTVKFDLDVPDTVMTIWSKGAPRDALSYFYRSALAYLATRHSLAVHDSATEGEALALVKDCADANVYQYFSEVTDAWQNLAYAERMPSDESVRTLCKRWPQLSKDQHSKDRHER
ncbi:MAG: hypothetical protein HKN70_04835 [Gammaproteobacteria bacterium]|nr:hypothetical protein [Gammaproteobacteria bacterium]